MELIDRKMLIKLSMKRLAEQARSIEKDIARDIEFIEAKTELLPNQSLAIDIEKMIAERMNRVDNLRVSLQMIALMQELLVKETRS